MQAVVTKAERYRQLYGRRKDRLLATLLPVGVAYDEAQESGELTTKRIGLVIEAACDSQLLVAMNASELLQALSKRWTETVAQAIQEIFQNPRAHARFAAICSLTKEIDDAVLVELLRAGLKDKSSRVRGKAATSAERLNRKDLLPELAVAVAVEKNTKARQGIEYHLRMLRDGYIINDKSEEPVYVWIRTASGYSGRRLSTDTIKAKGLEEAAGELALSVLEAE
jgi:hypothetical protein